MPTAGVVRVDGAALFAIKRVAMRFLVHAPRLVASMLALRWPNQHAVT